MRNVTCDMKSAIPRRMGRKKRWSEDMVARFAAGTFARIDAVLLPKPNGKPEDKTDFVRRAVDREIQRLERKAAKPERSKRAE
jgi:hypothetical protein